MNSLEHETQVKYVDGILAHSQEWQWLIDIIQNQFEFKEVNTWDDYINERVLLGQVLSYFINILKVCDTDWAFKKAEFEEIWYIAKYYIGIIKTEDCINELDIPLCKILFLCIWITKLENSDNGTNYLIDIGLLSLRNYFELIKCDSLCTYEDEIFEYAKMIPISGMDAPLHCLKDNVNKVEYLCDKKFLLRRERELVNYNAFSFQNLDTTECHTWQEVFLLNMVKISFKNGEIQPAIDYRNQPSEPDISMWTKENLKMIKNYFDNNISDFIVDTISYVLYKREPGKEVKLLHCKLLYEAINVEKEESVLSSSSYQVLSSLFQEKLLADCKEEEYYVNLIKALQKWEDPDLISILKNDSFPVSKNQNNILNEFCLNKYKKIDEVDSIESLLNYLQDMMATKQITTEYLRRVNEKFEKIVLCEPDARIPSAFYDYMIFLIRVNGNDQNIDIRYVQKLMIQLQDTWQSGIYEKQINNMQVFSYKEKINSDEIEKFSDLILDDPIILAQNCIPCTEEAILKIMESASEHPLYAMVGKMELTPLFPEKKGKIDFENGDEIDAIFLKYIKDIINEKEYKLLNDLDPSIYVEAIYERIRSCIQSVPAFFIKEKELYNSVEKNSSIALMPYSNKISLGYVTQLFPLLEMKIRELVKLFNMFPFKIDKGQGWFMQNTDPGSLLRKLIKNIYDEQQGFENIPDLLFIYDAMYNNNSCNVRNECIHGRDFLAGNKLHFAFLVTLLSIYMVDFRLQTIKENVSDIR